MSGSSDYTRTSNLGLYKPNYNMDYGNWGGHLNQNCDMLDSILATNGSGAFLPVSGVGGSGGPTWTQGTGAPSATQPKGSLYSRADGAVGSTLYVSQGGGTWNAVAGV